MKKMVKILSMSLAYLLLLSTIVDSNVVNAKEMFSKRNVKKYLNYSTLNYSNENQIEKIVQYKNKALVFSNHFPNLNYNYSLAGGHYDLYELKNNNYNKVSDNLVGNNISNLTRSDNIVNFSTYQYNSEILTKYYYDFNNSSVTKKDSEDNIVLTNKKVAIEKVNQKYNTNYDANEIQYFNFNEICDYKGNIYTTFSLCIDKNYNYQFHGVYNDNVEYISNSISVPYISFDNKNRLVIQEPSTSTLKIMNNKHMIKVNLPKNSSSNVYVVNNHLYILNRHSLSKYRYNAITGKCTLIKNFNEEIHSIHTDKNGNLWALKIGNDSNIICKLYANTLIEKYEINKNLYDLSIYDDNNITAYNTKMYTSIHK